MAKNRSDTATAPSTLTLKLDGAEVTAEKFLRGIGAFHALISDVSANVTEQDRPFRWLVGVREGSLLIDYRPVSLKASVELIGRTILAIQDGFETIEAAPQRPMFWSDVALRKAKELSDIVDATKQGLEHISVRADHRAKRITRRTSAHVESLIGTEVKALGSIEGRLRTVTEGGGLHIVVQDALTLNNVRCNIKEEHTEGMLAAFRKRVAVYGLIRYRKDGVPISIDVESFRVLRERHELPRASDVRGLLAV